jgi:hypothetical protein
MTKPVRTISIITSVLWATAIISSAILNPSFFTLMLLPMLGFASLATIVMIGRRLDISRV